MKKRRLSGLNAPRSVFFGLDMEGCELQGGDFAGCDFRGANLRDADLSDAVTLLADDGRGYELRFWQGRYLAGCRNYTWDEALAHWSDPHHECPASAALLHAAVLAHQE